MEQRLFYHEQKRLPVTLKYGPTQELLLLAPSTLVLIQHPQTKNWDTTGFIVSFSQNLQEYMVKSGHKQIISNLKFLKPIEVKVYPALRQPVQAPQRPDTPPASTFPVRPDWFQNPHRFTKLNQDVVTPVTPEEEGPRPLTISFGPDVVFTDIPPAFPAA